MRWRGLVAFRGVTAGAPPPPSAQSLRFLFGTEVDIHPHILPLFDSGYAVERVPQCACLCRHAGLRWTCSRSSEL